MTETIILIRRSGISGSVPPSGSLQVGELALNMTDGGVFYHDTGSDSVELIRVGTASFAATSSFAENVDPSANTGSFTGSFTGAFDGTSSFADETPLVKGEGSGAFTGTFIGDSSGLIGIVSASHSVKADVADSGTGSFTGSFIGDFTGSTSFTGSFTGAYEGEGSKLLNVFATGFTGTLDAINTTDDQRWRHRITTGFVERTTVGLIFRDQFNRPDSADVGNDWLQAGTPVSIEGNKYKITGAVSSASFWTGSLTANRFPVTGALNLPEKYMLQSNLSTAGASNLEISTREDQNLRTGSLTHYFIMIADGVNERRILKIFTGSLAFINSQAFSPVSGAFYGQRLIIEVTGSNLAYSGTFTAQLSSSSDLNAPFTDLILSRFDNRITGSETNIVAIVSEPGPGFMDEFIIQGTEVLVTNLPSGFKARIDNDAAVIESGGSASIDVKTKALPFATISVLNAVDVVQGQVFPQSASLSDGWGGDTYQYTNLEEYQFIPVSGSGEEEPVALAIRRDGDLVVGGGLGAVSASRFIGTSSFADTASTAESASFAVTADTASFVETASFALETQLVKGEGSGAFTGTFIGDSAGLIGVVSASHSLRADVADSGTGSFTGTFVGDFTGSTSFTGSFTGALAGTSSFAESASSASIASGLSVPSHSQAIFEGVTEPVVGRIFVDEPTRDFRIEVYSPDNGSFLGFFGRQTGKTGISISSLTDIHLLGQVQIDSSGIVTSGNAHLDLKLATDSKSVRIIPTQSPHNTDVFQVLRSDFLRMFGVDDTGLATVHGIGANTIVECFRASNIHGSLLIGKGVKNTAFIVATQVGEQSFHLTANDLVDITYRFWLRRGSTLVKKLEITDSFDFQSSDLENIGSVTASAFTGSFAGDGSELTGLVSASHAVQADTASLATSANALNPILAAPWSSTNGVRGSFDAELFTMEELGERMAALINDLLNPIPQSGWPDPLNGEAGAFDAESFTLDQAGKRMAQLIQDLKDAGILTT